MNDDQLLRYSATSRLPQIGIEGQEAIVPPACWWGLVAEGRRRRCIWRRRASAPGAGGMATRWISPTCSGRSCTARGAAQRWSRGATAWPGSTRRPASCHWPAGSRGGPRGRGGRGRRGAGLSDNLRHPPRHQPAVVVARKARWCRGRGALRRSGVGVRPAPRRLPRATTACFRRRRTSRRCAAR